MFSKYTEPRELLSWIKKYKTKKIMINNEINIAELFKNFCNSIQLSKNKYVFSQLHSFSILISKCILDDNAIIQVISSITNLLKSHEDINSIYMNSIVEAIGVIIQEYPRVNETYGQLLDALTQPK